MRSVAAFKATASRSAAAQCTPIASPRLGHCHRAKPSNDAGSRSIISSCSVRRSRPSRSTVKVRADASQQPPQHNSSSDDEPLYLPATASTYCPFSAELLLATTRQGHLERYREEVQQLYEPGQPVDLTRVALLISNIYQPQLDHRPYFEALEHLVAAAALAVMRKVSEVNVGQRSVDDSCAGFEGLDIQDPQHVLAAVQAINELLFVEEGLGVNAADPYDPLNGSVADLLDTRKGNQWTLAVVYLHILEGLGLPSAIVGTPDRIFIRVGHPPALVVTHTSSSSSSSSTPGADAASSCTPAVFLVDMAQPGVVFAYPPPVPPAEGPSSPGDTLRKEDSLATASSSSSSSAMCVSDEWNTALHAFLQQHQQDPQHSTADRANADADADAAKSADSADRPDASISSSSSSSSSRGEEFEVGSGTDDSSAWMELESYAAMDAATRNSWKALYGPGALTEWGGSVSSNSHYYNSIRSDSSWDGSEGGGAGGGNGASIGGMRAGQWLGVMDSPFAPAAAQPFGEGASADAAAANTAAAAAAEEGDAEGLASFSSMDTSCGSPVESMELQDDSSSSSPGSGGTGGSWGAGEAGFVPVLTWADVAAIGGLQPVSKRMVLQQLLGGMKLSLMMSGRQEELLLVLRYLRATDPFSLPDLRDMALCLAEQRPEEAAPLLREYLAVAPGAPDADMCAEVLAQVQLRVQLGRAKGWQ